MGFRVHITGDEEIDLNEGIVTDVQFISDTPNASNARSTDLGVIMIIKGRINFSIGAEVEDPTVKLATWALIPSDKADCYREMQVQIVSGDQIVRQYTYPNAFVMAYTENLNDDEGVGSFSLTLKQKKDLTENVELKGNFEV